MTTYVLTYLLTPIPAGMRGSKEGHPLLSVLGRLPNGTPVNVLGPHLFLYRSSPGVLWSASLALGFWCPVYGSAGDITRFSPKHVPSQLFMSFLIYLQLKRTRFCFSSVYWISRLLGGIQASSMRRILDPRPELQPEHQCLCCGCISRGTWRGNRCC